MYEARCNNPVNPYLIQVKYPTVRRARSRKVDGKYAPSLECGSLLPLCLPASLLAGCLNYCRYAERNKAGKLA